MSETKVSEFISAIVPTIGRPESLRRLLSSLATQTRRVQEVVVADASGSSEVEQVTKDPRWSTMGLLIRRIVVRPPNAVRQRQAAIRVAKGTLLLLLDDDVELVPDCVEQFIAVLEGHWENVAAVTANYNTQSWPQPTRLWRFYLKHIVGLADNAWQGKVVGPLLRFGYNPVPADPQPMEWLSTNNSLVRRSAYEAAGGFSDFFLYRCTTNEDVDLGIKLARVGSILFCPAALLSHYHAPGGRVSPTVAAEDDLYNRYMVLRRTVGVSFRRAFYLVALFFALETLSGLHRGIRRLNVKSFLQILVGRLRAFPRILLSGCRGSD
jgi:GT2 family glycosyltransferase